MIETDHLIVLGNGPSLADVDLRSINIPTIGMNAAYRYWDRIDWYPTYYACLDDAVIKSHADAIVRLLRGGYCKAFFLHQDILELHPELTRDPRCYFLSSFMDGPLHAIARLEHNLPSLDFVAFRPNRTNKVTTGSMAIRFGAYLGYRKILLLGIDANYVQQVEGAESGDGIQLRMAKTPEANPNYFFADYQQEGDVYNLPTPPTYNGNMHRDLVLDSAKDLARLSLATVMNGSPQSALTGHMVSHTLDEFLENARYSRLALALPDQLAAQPPYVPQAKGGLVFTRMNVFGSVKERECETWQFEDGGFEGRAVTFVFSKSGLSRGEGISSGDRISATFRASCASPVRARIARDGGTPFESTSIPVNKGEGKYTVAHTFKADHSAGRLEITMDGSGYATISDVVFDLLDGDTLNQHRSSQ